MRPRSAAIGRVIIGIRIGVTGVTIGIRIIGITCVATGIKAIRIGRVATFPVVPMPLNHRAGLYEWPVAARAAWAAAARAATSVISAIAGPICGVFRIRIRIRIRIKIGAPCR
jgi:hypothetical protein